MKKNHEKYENEFILISWLVRRDLHRILVRVELLVEVLVQPFAVFVELHQLSRFQLHPQV